MKNLLLSLMGASSDKLQQVHIKGRDRSRDAAWDITEPTNKRKCHKLEQLSQNQLSKDSERLIFGWVWIWWCCHLSKKHLADCKEAATLISASKKRSGILLVWRWQEWLLLLNAALLWESSKSESWLSISCAEQCLRMLEVHAPGSMGFLPCWTPVALEVLAINSGTPHAN